MRLTEQQNKILKHPMDANGHVIARAGSGKTFTEVEYVNRLKDVDKKKVILLCYNKHNADEARKKVDDGVEVKTFHALGYQALRKRYKYDRNSVDFDKYVNIMLDEFGEWDRQKRRVTNSIISNIHDSLIPVNDTELIDQTIKDYIEANDIDEFDAPNTEDVIHLMKVGSRRVHRTISGSEMLYVPLMDDIDFHNYQLGLIDEFQDTNYSQQKLAQKMCNRVLTFGDPEQCIYTWRGATYDKGDAVIAQWPGEQYGLTTTFRCPKSHIELVKHLVPDIEPMEGAIDGLVESISSSNMVKKLKDGDPENTLTICRVNEGLVSMFVYLTMNGVKAKIRGRSFGYALESLVEMLENAWHADYNTFLRCLGKYYEKRRATLESNNASDVELIALDDRVRSLMAAYYGADDRGATDMKGFKKYINSMFTDDLSDDGKYLLSTVHGAKGLEAKNVFLLNPELIPHPKAKSNPERLAEESRILYIAFTRSKENLYLVRGNTDALGMDLAPII